MSIEIHDLPVRESSPDSSPKKTGGRVSCADWKTKILAGVAAEKGLSVEREWFVCRTGEHPGHCRCSKKSISGRKTGRKNNGLTGLEVPIHRGDDTVLPVQLNSVNELSDVARISPDSPSNGKEEENDCQEQIPTTKVVNRQSCKEQAHQSRSEGFHDESSKGSDLTLYANPSEVKANSKKSLLDPDSTWAYGVTTIPSRRSSTLPKTLRSIASAGFPNPRLFIDGDSNGNSWEGEFKLEVTAHWPKIHAFGNWFLGLQELIQRHPTAKFFAIFQDDILLCKGVREYIEKTVNHDKAYYNLITYPQNDEFAPKKLGWYRSAQNGKGAQALVFPVNTAITLLAHQGFVARILDRHVNSKGHIQSEKNIDGAISEILKTVGGTEYVHSPSLANHQGAKSQLKNQPEPRIATWRGEGWDCRSL